MFKLFNKEGMVVSMKEGSANHKRENETTLNR